MIAFSYQAFFNGDMIAILDCSIFAFLLILGQPCILILELTYFADAFIIGRHVIAW